MIGYKGFNENLQYYGDYLGPDLRPSDQDKPPKPPCNTDLAGRCGESEERGVTVEIRTKYNVGQTVYVKTDYFSPLEKIECGECTGFGRIKGDNGSEDCWYCEGTGKATVRKLVVKKGRVIEIKTKTREVYAAQHLLWVGYRIEFERGLTQEFDEHRVFPTREEAEAGVTV